jgi:hypothetical protein
LVQCREQSSEYAQSPKLDCRIKLIAHNPSQTIAHFARLDFAEVHSLAHEYYDEFSLGQKEQIAQWNAVASWAVGDFLNMSHYLTHMKKGSSKILYKYVKVLNVRG